MADRRRPRERPPGAAELALPAVRVRERVGLARIVGREARESPKPLALGRSRLDRPGQPGERPPRRVPPHVVRVEELAHGLPERARLARRAVVGRRLPHEREQPARPGAGGVEEVAVAARGVGALQPRAACAVEIPARLVVEERRRGRPARQRSLLETDHEDRLEAARARPRQVENRDAARLAGGVAADGRPVEGREDVVGVDRRRRPRAAAPARRGPRSPRRRRGDRASRASSTGGAPRP